MSSQADDNRSFSKLLKVLSAAGFQISINSYAQWRDFDPPAANIGWSLRELCACLCLARFDPAALTHSSWIPNVGIAPIRDYANQIKYILQQASARETGLLEYLKSYALSGAEALKRIALEKPYQPENGYPGLFNWGI